MALVVDGVFFQLAQSGIARIWRAILPLLSQRLDMPVVLLDRGGIDLAPPGIEVVPFPTYKSSKFNPADSQLLEQVCRHYGAQAFISTYYSTPLETPSLLMVYDMIPERMQFDMNAREWCEKELAIAHARRHVCISQSTRADLLDFYPELNPDHTSVAYCGVDPEVFRPRPQEAVAALRNALGLHRPYFIFVGSRVQTKNYKNASHFFEAAATLSKVDFDVLCVGGEKASAGQKVDDAGHRIVQVDLDDDQLAIAYSGATALVYPSLYEGFGLPVAEAMASGCPVICTHKGSLAEVAGDATVTISGLDISEMTRAMNQVREPSLRTELVERGKRQAQQFRWEPMADELELQIRRLAEEARIGQHADFYHRWARLRRLQAEVDTKI